MIALHLPKINFDKKEPPAKKKKEDEKESSSKDKKKDEKKDEKGSKVCLSFYDIHGKNHDKLMS